VGIGAASGFGQVQDEAEEVEGAVGGAGDAGEGGQQGAPGAVRRHQTLTCAGTPARAQKHRERGGAEVQHTERRGRGTMVYHSEGKGERHDGTPQSGSQRESPSKT